MRFLHIADVHLGYQQYGLKDRFDDFSRAFLHLVDTPATRTSTSCSSRATSSTSAPSIR